MSNLKIDIATAKSRSRPTWINRSVSWCDLVTKLSKVFRTHETYKSYMSMTKDEQGNIKDVGGFVGGYLQGGKRKSNTITHRQLLTLDLDFAPIDFWDSFTMIWDCEAVLHTTHKHSVKSPRYRLIVPLSEEVARDEYQAISRMFASTLELEYFDPTTFQPHRLMYWPSASKDGDWIFKHQKGRILTPDELKGMYNDWRNISEWPFHNEFRKVITGVDKQENPTDKPGVVGIFCRTYSIPDVIETFFPDLYEEVTPGERYTYREGTTSGGMVVYDGGMFSYSHHSTDPTSGQMCNAFDFFRIHKFGHLDTNTESTGKNMRSYVEAEKFIRQQPAFRKQAGKEAREAVNFDFKDIIKKLNREEHPDTEKSVKPAKNGLESYEEEYNDEELESDEEFSNWADQLEYDGRGNILNNSSNLNVIFTNDPMLKGAFAYNEFDGREYLQRSTHWRKIKDRELVRDGDLKILRNYLECEYGISSPGKVDDALALQYSLYRYHPIREYLESLEWDGTPRVDELLINVFGAKDNIYTREAIRKMLVGAVARVYKPGIKFDYCCVICGTVQGTGKSTFVRKLGKEWFSDTFVTFKGKEAFEQLQGKWLIEIAELSAMRKAEIEAVKHFLSKETDSFRGAYKRVVEDNHRQNVFFATTNNKLFLQDVSGNRRFLPIQVREEFSTLSSLSKEFSDMINQIWAEAYHMYKGGESLILSKQAEAIAQIERENCTEIDERTGIIVEYLERRLPKDWDEMGLEARMVFLDSDKEGTEERLCVCPYEVWCECFGNSRRSYTKKDAREINDMLRSIKGWTYNSVKRVIKIYGQQRVFEKDIF